ncbi:MAG: protein-tyrosine phosphatase family protein [Aliidongia sp.]
MRPQVYWIEQPMSGRLAIMSRPRAGDWLDDEISGWRTEGIDIVLSLLEQEEISELGLQSEASLCRNQGMVFLSFPIPDRGVPASLRETVILTQALARDIGNGRAVAVHCRAGIGRSSLIAACTLVCLGADPAAAFDMIAKARGVGVPDTEGQRNWVTVFRESI